MKITLVRHTEVDEKYHKKYNGHIDIGLSRRGIEQAEALAALLKDELFDLVYASDLLRSRQTLAPFIQAKNAIFIEELREKFWGRHEGKSFDEIITEGEIKYENFEQWIEALDGEPYEAYMKRVQHFFLEYLPKQNANTVLVITHAGVIRVLMAIVKDLSLEEAFCIDVPYASATVFDTDLQTFSTIK
ncbi:histidine phosphatase family protein [Sulfurimonas paralvinellae]|uniref:Histidine phosphatase family protein n=1 Tax=Sulfurimonas paralvinellae TaxID=317658 RepID=A0A7M1B5N5_9BACT|nr:histidine phosphatase family protein [Sulfurimonas paralvinellae]QOP44826.1 histidine phosphatase family protein [Sulfurimonas paralvinellae]